MIKLVFALTFLSVLTSCSPFGGESLISPITNIVDKVFTKKASGTIVSGGTDVINTNPGTPSMNYKVSLAVGNQMSQPAILTGGGYKVYTGVQ